MQLPEILNTELVDQYLPFSLVGCAEVSSVKLEIYNKSKRCCVIARNCKTLAIFQKNISLVEFSLVQDFKHKLYIEIYLIITRFCVRFFFFRSFIRKR